MEAIEGKRAEPRNKPPFPVTNGLWNKPTALNNVETLHIRTADPGERRRLVQSAGHERMRRLEVRRRQRRRTETGRLRVPDGHTDEEVIFQQPAADLENRKRLKAFAPSGPSSGYLPASMVDVHIDFKSLAAAGSMMGSAAIVVCAEGRCMLDMALNAVRFFRNESCGKCVPCRTGSQKMIDILMGWTAGQGNRRGSWHCSTNCRKP